MCQKLFCKYNHRGGGISKFFSTFFCKNIYFRGGGNSEGYHGATFLGVMGVIGVIGVLPLVALWGARKIIQHFDCLYFEIRNKICIFVLYIDLNQARR